MFPGSLFDEIFLLNSRLHLRLSFWGKKIRIFSPLARVSWCQNPLTKFILGQKCAATHFFHLSLFDTIHDCTRCLVMLIFVTHHIWTWFLHWACLCGEGLFWGRSLPEVLHSAECNFVRTFLEFHKFELFHLLILHKRLHETFSDQVSLDHKASILDKPTKGFPRRIVVVLPLHLELYYIFVFDSCDSVTNNVLNMEPSPLFWLLWLRFFASHFFVEAGWNMLLMFSGVSFHTALSNRHKEVFLVIFFIILSLARTAALFLHWMLRWTLFLLIFRKMRAVLFLFLSPGHFSKFEVLGTLMFGLLLFTWRFSPHKTQLSLNYWSFTLTRTHLPFLV